MGENRKRWKFAINLAAIVVGNLMYAAAVVFFIVPNNLTTGGTTGLALFVNWAFGIPISLFVSLFNVTMFLWGAWVLGKQFALTTVLSTLIYPFLLGTLERCSFTGFVLDERLTAVIYAGLLIGGGIGVVMRAGASTGGMDIPALVLKKKFDINVSLTIYLLDCLVLGLQLIETDAYSILYGILLIMAYTMVLNQVLMAGNTRMQVKIVSKKHDAINRILTGQLDCGTSLLHMETGFLHDEQKMILAVIPKRDLPRLNHLVLEADPEAFMVINQINEVRGRGFTLKRVYREVQR